MYFNNFNSSFKILLQKLEILIQQSKFNNFSFFQNLLIINLINLKRSNVVSHDVILAGKLGQNTSWCVNKKL